MRAGWRAAVGAGALLAAGLLFMAASAGLELGTLRRLGPGAYPLAAAAALTGLAAILLVSALTSGEVVDRPEWGPAFAIGGALAAFAAVTPMFGVLPGAFCAVVAASSADRRPRWPGKLALGAAVAAGVWAIFIVGLKLPFTAFRGF